MKTDHPFEVIRQWVVVICITTTASIFHGAVVAGIIRYAFDMEPGAHMFWYAAPVSLICAVYLFPRMWKVLGFR